ncbi:proline-rich transmembrane protein 4-like [Patiria miniata]|uniref:Proline-rich transmembrane protein 3/4 domain-containing protein n=1 Tax=Patiria miniata TaxID=46514 RepID=A0A914ADL3_PATMI|nr:proline-rich transmembrane protein 4-like [Patiria miniata]
MASHYLSLTLLCVLLSWSLPTTSGDVPYNEMGNTTTSPVNRNMDTSMGKMGTAEPEPEPETEPEPEGEPTGEPEPSGEPEPTGAAELPPFAEPVPNWEEALPLYGVFWIIHIYILGSLFALLALYSFVSLIRLKSRRLLSRGYFVALNIMMLLMGLDRAIYFFVDAYNYKGIFPLSVAYMLLGMGFPCLSSAFSILFLALLHSTRTRLVSPKIQRAKVLAGIIVFHFTVSIVVDVVVGVFTSAQVLLLLCQGVFLIWGLFLSISYLIIFRRLHKSSVRQFREINRMSISRRTSTMYGISPFLKKPRNNWGSAIKVTLFASFFGVVIGLLQLYGIVVVYGPLGEKVPEPWSWVWYQLAFRICELVMCILMSYVATQPFRYTVNGTEIPMCMCCTNIIEAITGKSSHDLQLTDDYRLVNNDASMPVNDFVRGAEDGVVFDPMEAQHYHSANLQLPPSNTFHREDAREKPVKTLTFSSQAPDSETEIRNDSVADNNKKNLLKLEMSNTGVSLSDTCKPATAPVSTQGYLWNEQSSPIITSDLNLGDIKSCNQNKNNHHSCPSTPIQGRGSSETHLSSSCHSLSNLQIQSSGNQGSCQQTSAENSSPVTPEITEAANDSAGERTDQTQNACSETKPDAINAEVATERLDNSQTDANQDLAGIRGLIVVSEPTAV